MSRNNQLPPVPPVNRRRRAKSPSSARWLQRQQRDPWARAAQQQGYRSRSACKLLEIDRRFRFLRPGARVLDLGAAPGGWSQVAARRTGAGGGREWVLGVDVQDVVPVDGCRFIKCAFPAAGLAQEVQKLLGRRVDVLLSDMLGNVSGNRIRDHANSLELCRSVERFAADVLSEDGMLCCKLLRGGDPREEQEMLADWSGRFRRVLRFKPQASRSESAEIYLLAFKG